MIKKNTKYALVVYIKRVSYTRARETRVSIVFSPCDTEGTRQVSHPLCCERMDVRTKRGFGRSLCQERMRLRAGVRQRLILSTV